MCVCVLSEGKEGGWGYCSMTSVLCSDFDSHHGSSFIILSGCHLCFCSCPFTVFVYINSVFLLKLPMMFCIFHNCSPLKTKRCCSVHLFSWKTCFQFLLNKRYLLLKKKKDLNNELDLCTCVLLRSLLPVCSMCSSQRPMASGPFMRSLLKGWRLTWRAMNIQRSGMSWRFVSVVHFKWKVPSLNQ